MKPIPRPAATVVLMREGADGPEVMMLQRTQGAAFLAGAYVFPGGALDSADGDARSLARVSGLSDGEASRLLGLDRGGLAYWVAAMRECFEEAGILLAHDERGRAVSPARVEQLARFRAPLNAGELAFADFLEGERLTLPAGELAYIGHWITAPGRPRRFDTRFFVAAAPQGQSGSHDARETIHHLWIRPQDALARGERGEIELVFATKHTLTELAQFEHPRRAVDYARAKPEVETNRACWAQGSQGPKLFRRADPQYFEIHWCDPEETGESSYEIVPGAPKRLDRLVTRITAPNPGMMTGPGTNSYLVGERELALIDPGPAIDSHVQALIAAGAGRIRWILCTHTHLDHSPAAAALKEATGATVIGRPAPQGASQDQSFAPERVPAHGERLELGGVALRALHTPGHASNHLCYRLEETKMLFTGDHVMQGSTVVINPPDGDMRAYLLALEGLLEEDVAVFAPGHGFLIGQPQRELRRLIAHRLAREAKVVAALERLGRATLEQLVPAVYDDVHPRLHPVAARSLTAHLHKLAAEGNVGAQDGWYHRDQGETRERG
ncbi:MAG TPA: MBL fold metallo-hydrolase [Burkholderiales bacterium]|nr:MBL fold metallo-hydrolase [Burkholderiales bacterium]